MGTNKVVKRTKTIKKRGRGLVVDGKRSGVAQLSKDNATEINGDNVAEVLVKPRKLISDKSKKIRKIKKKVPLLSNEESNAVKETAEEDSPKVKKDSLKNVRKNKRKHASVSDKQSTEVSVGEEIGPVVDGSEREKDDLKKVRKNKRKHASVSDDQSTEVSVGEGKGPVIDGSKGKKDKSKRARKSKTKETLISSEHITISNDPEVQPDVKDLSGGKNGKLKKAKKQKNASHSTVAEAKSVKAIQEVPIEDVYQISSGDDDDSKGMKKWIKQYHERRPGIQVLQEKIDDFITAYEEKEEQAKREKEASLAEDGWTVVVHRKGGKKTADSESGIAVGAVAEAAVREKMAKKKSKDVGLDFYRFQRKEANRSEIMKLQSKFEEDKKRIQQLRAARKFNPY
ncbi:hypothetical protein vseg_002376 [Gypsophila vaccaria]